MSRIPTRHHTKQVRADLLIRRCRNKAFAIEDRASDLWHKGQHEECERLNNLADTMMNHIHKIRKIRGSVTDTPGHHKSMTDPSSCYFE